MAPRRHVIPFTELRRRDVGKVGGKNASLGELTAHIDALGVPAIVGTGRATETLHNGQAVTASCAEGERGHVYDGLLPYEETETDLSALAPPRRG
ncbi:hypothetical protein [Streptomyces sp. NBC_01022]|uniref:hypothetical protein n=1 Tax=Streptomyces sp. NBC_01022 TaxID=2903723 RepID=UPI002DDAE594|nr:hypothetical protein [Streptomyces sp. NBC_01022]WRZ80007.1 hypothetical protein OG316_06930 [Streptomyces sp. NBC_01022]